MSKMLLVPLCAAAVMLAACNKHDEPKMENDPANPAATTPTDPAATPDTSTTPGGTAGETAAPDATQPATPAEPPPGETPPSDTQANPPPQS